MEIVSIKLLFINSYVCVSAAAVITNITRIVKIYNVDYTIVDYIAKKNASQIPFLVIKFLIFGQLGLATMKQRFSH